jgi:hypothetical protein
VLPCNHPVALTCSKKRTRDHEPNGPARQQRQKAHTSLHCMPTAKGDDITKLLRERKDAQRTANVVQRRLLAPLRRADEYQECPLIGVDRKGLADGQSNAIDPNDAETPFAIRLAQASLNNTWIAKNV